MAQQPFLRDLVGRRVTVFCANYIYNGHLDDVTEDGIKLSAAKLVFETGPFDGKDFADAQALPNQILVQTRAIEMVTELH